MPQFPKSEAKATEQMTSYKFKQSVQGSLYTNCTEEARMR